MDLEAMIRAIVRDELARTRAYAAQRGSELYSNRRESWPPGARSGRSARERIRAVPGHVHAERGLWTVTKELYHLHHQRNATPALSGAAERSAARRGAALGVRDTQNDEELAAAAIAAAGLRQTRRSA